MPTAALLSPCAPARFTASGRLEPVPPDALPPPIGGTAAGGYRVRPQPDGSALLLNAAGDVLSPFVSVELANKTLAFLTR